MRKRDRAARFVGRFAVAFCAGAMTAQFRREVAKATVEEMSKHGIWIPKEVVGVLKHSVPAPPAGPRARRS